MPAAPPPRQPGQPVVVNGDRGAALAAADRADLDAARDAGKAGDAGRLADLAKAGRITLLPNGTAGAVVGAAGDAVLVEVATGNPPPRRVWVPAADLADPAARSAGRALEAATPTDPPAGSQRWRQSFPPGTRVEVAAGVDPAGWVLAAEADNYYLAYHRYVADGQAADADADRLLAAVKAVKLPVGTRLRVDDRASLSLPVVVEGGPHAGMRLVLDPTHVAKIAE